MHAVGSQQHIKERVTLQRMRRSSQNQPFLVWTTFRRGLIVGGKTTPRFDNLICSLYTRASQQPLAAPCETRFRKHRRINHTHLSIRAKRCRENSSLHTCRTFVLLRVAALRKREISKDYQRAPEHSTGES